MELSAEINRVFGQEMAKIFAGSIDENEIKTLAKNEWQNYVNAKYTYTYSNREYYEYESQASFLIKKEFANILKDEVEKLTSTDTFKEEMKNMAESIVNEIVSETRRKMIDTISDRMVGLSTGFNGYNLKGMIQQTVIEMMQPN